MRILTISFLAVALAACSREVPKVEGADAAGFSAPTSATAKAQADTAAGLPVEDGNDMQEAERGLVAREPSLKVMAADGSVAYDADGYQFIKGDAPGSVNPGLWRQAKLNNLHGLY